MNCYHILLMYIVIIVYYTIYLLLVMKSALFTCLVYLTSLHLFLSHQILLLTSPRCMLLVDIVPDMENEQKYLVRAM